MTLSFRREQILFFGSFFPKVLLEPQAKFPQSSPVTAKAAKTRSTHPGPLTEGSLLSEGFALTTTAPTQREAWRLVSSQGRVLSHIARQR